MNIHLDANATTTPKARHSIQASTQSVTQPANEPGVSKADNTHPAGLSEHLDEILSMGKD